MLLTETLPWWYDLAKWLIGGAVGGAGMWSVAVAAKAARTVKMDATVALVDKHEVRIRDLEDTKIRVHEKLTYIERGVDKLLAKAEGR